MPKPKVSKNARIENTKDRPPREKKRSHYPPSDVIKRRTHRPLSDFVGLLSPKAVEEIRAAIEDSRKERDRLDRERLEDLGGFLSKTTTPKRMLKIIEESRKDED